MPVTLGMLAPTGPAPRIVATYSARDGVNKSTFTWNNVLYGSADPSRFLIIQAMMGGASINSLKVDGVVPTLLASANGDNNDVKIYKIAVPTGIQGTIVFSGGGSPLGAALAVHAVYNCGYSEKQSGTKSGGVDANSFPALTLSRNDVAYFTDYGASTVVTWTGANATVTDYVNGTSNRYGTATLQPSTSGSYTVATNRTVTFWPKYFVWGK